MDIMDIVSEALTTDEQRVRRGLLEDGYDLPELADTMEDADARAAASTYLFAMRNVQGALVANEAEYRTLAAFQQRRHDERQGPLERQVDWLHEAVKTLFSFMRPTGKKKSLNLIGGRVGMRSQTAELVVEDDEAVIVWAKDQGFPSLVKIKPTLDRKALRAYMAAPSTISGSPPGVTLERRVDAFYATPAKD